MAMETFAIFFFYSDAILEETVLYLLLFQKLTAIILEIHLSDGHDLWCYPMLISYILFFPHAL